MGKNKLEHFEESKTFTNFFQHSYQDITEKGFPLKGNWHKEYFKNDNPIIVELGCGKGEYTIGLAEKNPNINYIGVDLKGARIWRGAKTATENKMQNVAFIRARIEMIEEYFAKDELSEIWITFPDPQARKRRTKKRLTGSRFLTNYTKILKPEGIVNLKTDSNLLYNYTKALLEKNEFEILAANSDIYKDDSTPTELTIKTHYEQMFLDQGENINYLKFLISRDIEIVEPDEDFFIESTR